MTTEILHTAEMPLDVLAKKAAEYLENGKLVAFPTETVYGLGGNGLDPEAARKIYEAKGRPSDNPLILHIGDRSQLFPLVREIPEKAEKMMDAFWPGPLTMIFKKTDLVPKETCGGLSTVAVRMPSHETARAMLQACSVPVAAPSANLSGRPSTTKTAHVIEDLSGRVDAIIDDREADIGLESTILDMTQEPPCLLRPGYITKEQIEQVIGPVDVDPAITRESIVNHTNEVLHPKAPGMKYRHYAPEAPVYVISGPTKNVLRYINSRVTPVTGILTVDEHRNLFFGGVVRSAGSIKDPEQIAHNLFDVLREFDKTGVKAIYSEDFTDIDIGTVIMNRLLKAAGGNITEV